ncbi:MAG TPA: IS1595 family transposase, partial [Pyrinomonadaceae bacterium]
VKFKGMRRSTFYLHLKECEFRFNHRDEDLYQLLLKITRSAFAI